EPLPQGQLTAY
nr:Chain C, BZLF1 trans-activator protein [synthetic construct]2NW3_C Chain C, EBV peptide EPLPQGQLTAY [synthetic construct]2NX5_C Chain C, EBV peptide, EPLPQGQLTAY [synthetic construct]2NX5_H Chain H, EBV peptide, EPLPQGQLTAY [synthetic construct]2NX5_M Chain M, EBV peptide, EPLPQGQLTAY [synthetic construct]2NX5_S Chain S, EBV peptide, EPLPQGQLTAY [synthetic construct]